MRQPYFHQLGLLLAVVAFAPAWSSLRIQSGTNVEVDVLLHTEREPAHMAVGPLNPAFAGFSVEWSLDLLFLSEAQGGLYNTTLQLFRNLQEATGAAPPLRVGGNSADTTWWRPPGATPPSWVHKDMASPPNLIDQLAAFFEELDAGNVHQAEPNLVLDLNFREGDDPELAVNEAKYLAAQFGARRWRHIKAFEIGNECDLYADKNDEYRNASSWSPVLYTTQWSRFAQAVASAVVSTGGGGPVQFQGATFCCRKDWFAFLPKFIDEATTNNDAAWRMASVSVHLYPLAVCDGRNVSLDQLLAHVVPDGAQLDGLAAAQARGVEYWLAETNSVACGGQRGVSDVFGSALWAIDWLFNGAALGYRGMNFHGAGSGAAYAPWSYAWRRPPAARGLLVHPLYYAMLGFARTLGGPAAYILPLNSPLLEVKTSPPSFLSSSLSVWSVGDAASGARKLVINHRGIAPGSSNNASVTVRLTTGGWHKAARLTRLEAPSAYATTNVRLGGQTFDGSTDGRLRGTAHVTWLYSATGVEWRFEVQAASTAFFTVCPDRGPAMC